MQKPEERQREGFTRQRIPLDKFNHTHCSSRCRFVRRYRSSLLARSQTIRREEQARADTGVSEELEFGTLACVPTCGAYLHVRFSTTTLLSRDGQYAGGSTPRLCVSSSTSRSRSGDDQHKTAVGGLGDAFEPTFADAFHRVHRHLAGGVHAHNPEHVVGERHCSR
jgi:hypothetical protein